MTATDLGVLIGAVGAFLALVGGGLKWLLTTAALKESEARADLYTRFQQEIAEQRQEITALRLEVAQLRAMSNIYMKRVYQLESFIHNQPGIQIPVMDGWPPA